MTALPFLLRNWKLIVGGLGLLVLGLLLADARSDARRWKGEAERFSGLYHGEKAAHAGTVSNYRAAAAKAERIQAEKVARVEAAQKAINERTASEYQAQLAAVRERYARLVRDAGKARTDPRTAEGVSVPEAPGAPAGIDGASGEGGLPPRDALIATETALRLVALQEWVRQQVGVSER